MIRCEVKAHTLDLARSWCLRDYEGPTPRTALRWMRWQAGRVADQLDPGPWPSWAPHGALAPVALAVPDGPAELRAWRDDLEAHTEMMTALRSGLPVSITVHDDTAHYTITALPERPALRTPPGPTTHHPETAQETPS